MIVKKASEMSCFSKLAVIVIPPVSAIPEFYRDIFTSLHPDLPDLNLPSLAETG